MKKAIRKVTQQVRKTARRAVEYISPILRDSKVQLALYSLIPTGLLFVNGFAAATASLACAIVAIVAAANTKSSVSPLA